MRVIITASGKGERMKGLSPLPKHYLHYKDKRIIDWLKEVYPEAEVLDGYEALGRKELLTHIKDYTDCLILDCDIILPERLAFDDSEDCLWYFKSNKDKYGSIQIQDGGIIAACETRPISNDRCSGAYFIKSIAKLIERMESDSIAEGMVGAYTYREDNFIRVGDPSDYYEALGIHPTSFTGNRITFNEKTVIKHCKTGYIEQKWYRECKLLNIPDVKFADDEMIITERIYPTQKITAVDFIRILEHFKYSPNWYHKYDFKTYLDNLPPYDRPIELPEHEPTFFHGDLSTHNVLKNSRVWLIDPNYKDIFGSWLTDAGKAVFSFIAYEQDWPEAKKIVDHFGNDVLSFAVAEGLRVCKYRPEYISIVNNIADIRDFTITSGILLLHNLKTSNTFIV